MKGQKEKNDFIQIRISKDIKEKYLKYCDENGFTPSKKIRLFIEKELNEKNKI